MDAPVVARQGPRRREKGRMMRNSMRARGVLVRSACGALAASVGLALAAGLAGCDSKSAQVEGDAVDIATVQVRSFEITTLAMGELAAKQRVELRSEVERPTTVVEIVAEGTRVQAGDVLVRLNTDEIRRELEEEELQVSEARLQLEAAETSYDIQVSDNAADLRKAQLKVDMARLALEQWVEGDKVKRLKELETAIEKATRDRERLREKKEKSDELYRQEFISYDEWKRDEISLLEAEANYDAAVLDKEVYINYQMKRDHEQKLSDLEEAQQELTRVIKSNEINLKNKDSARQNRAVQLARRQERLDNYLRQEKACTIVAPQAGLVVYGSTAQSDNWRWQSEGPIAVGRQIQNNDLLITLPDTSEMIANVKVHESMAGRVRPGQRALISIEALGGLTLDGEVESIGLLAETGGWRDPNRREYTVRILVDAGENGQLLKPSMRCQAEVVLGTVDQALAVPVQAVFSDGPVRYVLVPNGPRFERRPVQLGRRSDMYAQIAMGLVEGERVLVREPLAGEVDAAPWTPEALAAGGYSVDEQGKPMAMDNGRGGFGGMPQQGARPQGRGRPGQGGTPGGSEAPAVKTETETTVAEGDQAPKAEGEAQKPAEAEGAATPQPAATEASKQ